MSREGDKTLAYIILGLVVLVLISCSVLVAPAFSEEVEKVPILHMHADNSVTLETVELPKVPGYITYVCLRSMEARKVNCYLINELTHKVVAVPADLVAPLPT